MQFSEQALKKAVTFSFDDGTTQDIRMVELLNQYGLKATFNINSQLLGNRDILELQGHKLSHYKLDPGHVRELYQGHEVACHTCTHPYLTQLEDAQILQEVAEDCKTLEALTGQPVVGMAYPYGATNDRVIQILREQTPVRYARLTGQVDSFDPQENLLRLRPHVHFRKWDRLWELGRQFVELQPETPQIFYIWGHTYDMDFDSENWAKMEEFFRFISGRSDIFYGTNAQVLL